MSKPIGFGKKQYQQTLVDPVAFHKYILGNPFKLSPPQIDIMRAIAKYYETLVIAGSKGGKSTLSSDVCLWRIYLLLQMKSPQVKYGLNPYSKLYNMIIAPKEDTAVNITFNYTVGFAHDSWYLSQFIHQVKYEELIFSHGQEGMGKIIVRAQGSSSKAGRGYQIFTVIADEFAHFLDTKGNQSGLQVVNAYMPRLLPFGRDGRFIAITTPAGRNGVAWDMFTTGTVLDKKYILQPLPTQGQHDFRAVFQLPTWELNPLYPIDHPFLIKERKRDSWFFEREYGAKFADVVSAFFPEQLLERCFKTNIPIDKSAEYVIALDPSGGEKDPYGLAMGYMDDKGKVIITLVMRWVPTREEPLNIVEVEETVRELCKQYRVVDIIMDKHLGLSTIQRLELWGLPVRGLAYSAKTDIRIYQPFLELVHTGEIWLPDMPELKEELKMLERIALTDRYRVKAPRGGTDDMSDCIAMVIYDLKIEGVTGGMLII